MSFFRYTAAMLLVALGCGCSHKAVSVADWNQYLAATEKADLIDDPVQRCLAYPDLPGNEWPEGSAKGQCMSLAEHQKPSLKEIEATLDQPDGVAKLDKMYAGILDAHYKVPDRREGIFTAYQDFSTSEGMNVAKTWLARAPQSVYARMAMGDALVGMASHVRGDATISKVPKEKIEKMVEILAQAEPILKSALADEPRLSTACNDLMFIGQLNGDQDLEVSAGKHCLQVDRLSWNVNFRWLRGFDPRWGGSFAEMDRAVDKIRTRVADNPALGGLLVRSAGLKLMLADDKDEPHKDVVAQLDGIAHTAPDPFYLHQAGIVAEKDRDSGKALGYLSQAIRFAPNNTSFFSDRALTKFHLGKTLGALQDAKHALEMNDAYCQCRNYGDIAEVYDGMGKVDEARAVYQQALKSDPDHEWAIESLCNTYMNGTFDRERALACTQQIVTEYPNKPQALYERASALYMAHDPGADAVAARFHQMFDDSDPQQIDMDKQLAWLVAHPFPHPEGGSTNQ